MSKVWKTICSTEELVENSGVSALIECSEESIEKQIALFYVPHTSEKVFAVSNYDPIGKANVMSRGIVGSVAQEPVVASPLYKQHFSLITGKCLQDDVSLDTYPVRVNNEQVQVLA